MTPHHYIKTWIKRDTAAFLVRNQLESTRGRSQLVNKFPTLCDQQGKLDGNLFCSFGSNRVAERHDVWVTVWKEFVLKTQWRDSAAPVWHRHMWCTFPAPATRIVFLRHRCDWRDLLARAQHDGTTIQPIRAQHFQVTRSLWRAATRKEDVS